jgi:predicted NUDIX family NTP pyrophosphohydrolase
MPKQSAGILLYRVREGAVEDPLAAALREFREETGQEPPRAGDLLELGTVPGGAP